MKRRKPVIGEAPVSGGRVPVEQTEEAKALEDIAQGIDKTLAAELYGSLTRITTEFQLNAAFVAMGGDLQEQGAAVPYVNGISRLAEYFSRQEQKYGVVAHGASVKGAPVEQTEEAKAIERVAQRMERPRAARLYGSLTMMMGKCQENAALAAMEGGSIQRDREALPSIDRISQWTQYFARQEQRYSR